MTYRSTLDCDGVLFDCDGVLVDSDDSVVTAWSRWAEQLSLDPTTVVEMVHGRRSADTVALLVAPDERAAALALIDRFEIEDAAGVTALPGAGELLASIPGDRWAVVTSGRRDLATARLRAAGLPIPTVLVTADDVERGKPDPQGYLTAAASLGLDPARAIVFEDAVSGVDAARAAGVGAVVGVGTRARLGPLERRVENLAAVGWESKGLVFTDAGDATSS